MSRLSLLRPAKLINVLKAIEPDLVHSHSGVWLRASHAARAAGVRAVVHTEHGRPDPVPYADRVSDNVASRRTDVIIAVSEPLAAVLRRQVVHDASKLRVIANGVDTEGLKPLMDRCALRQELGIPPDAAVIGSIGRLEPVKNYQLMLRAFARLGSGSWNGRPPWLVLVGDGSERASLEQLAVELRIDTQVKFLGWRADAEKLYVTFDLFALTSTSEGTSMSLLEAMSCGVCPAVTDVGGNRSVLGPELNSLLVPSGDEAAVADLWHRLLRDPARRELSGHHARLRAQKAFSLDQMVEQHVALYRELLTPKRTPSRNGVRTAPGPERAAT
jgi:glycosyltransferase involved in cell wall biosynthesis